MNAKVEINQIFRLPEFSFHIDADSGELKRELREMEDVPDARYVVERSGVFVFDKLVDLVKQRRDHSDLPFADLVRGLLPKAIVSGKEAVEIWGIIPEPYELTQHPEGGWIIRHRAFNARLPGQYESPRDAHGALSNLLLGGIQPGEGEFTYRGQSMSLCDPIGTASLPSRPVFPSVKSQERDSASYMALGNVEYVPGFEPIPRALFDDIKERENTWIRERDNAGRYARENAEVVWERAGALPLETLNEGVDEPPEDAQIVELRSFYPELHMLQDGALYEWFNWYQMDCCYMGSWTPERDNGFLFYLLGKVAIKGSEEPRPEDVGECVAYALLHGYTWDEALDFGRATASYDGAIRSRAQNVATAMRFLKEDRVSEGSRGQPIRTMFDLFREGRKYNCHRYSLTLSEG